MSYGLDFSDGMRRAAAIIDKILRGADPAEIPFELPDRPSFRLDRRLARAIGVEIPNDVLLRVTELVD
jgi:putative ABC transport system substrate-binding protein